MPLSKIKKEQLKELDEKYVINPHGNNPQLEVFGVREMKEFKAFLSASITKACEEMINEIKLEKKKWDWEKDIDKNPHELTGYNDAIDDIAKKQEEFLKK